MPSSRRRLAATPNAPAEAVIQDSLDRTRNYGKLAGMKTTIELPDATFRQAKTLATARGVTLKRFFTEALDEHLRRCTGRAHASETEAPWMAGFGVLSDLADENRRILGLVEQEFETVSSDDLT